MKRKLKQFGLTDAEVEVYLACLQGKQTPSQVAEQTGMKRTSVYMHIDTLKAKGLLATRAIRRKRIITATPPNQAFAHLVNREEQNLLEKKSYFTIW